ncbi:MAG: GNAT family N-acetyltransferase [Bacteroidetes bacterium]|nr:GNAT family N-acetyltransferase [Bacteroidota bacterium]
MITKETYIQYCLNKEIGLFQQAWWLDAVCGTNWDVVFAKNKESITGAWAYPIKKKKGFCLINMPLLSIGTAPVITYYEGQKESSQVSHEQQITESLIQALPAFDLFDLYFLPSHKNHLPFFWNGFEQTTRYTYIINDLSDINNVFERFDSSTRTQIRKAEKEITVIESSDIDLFYQINTLSFSRQNKKVPYSLSYVKQIDEACTKHACRKILVAKDAQQNIHAAFYLVWDAQSAYYLMGGADEQYRSSGAYSLLMWAAIKEAAKVSKSFNFCGSMLPSVNRFFRSFGGKQTPYLHIKKTNSKSLRLLRAIKKLRFK